MELIGSHLFLGRRQSVWNLMVITQGSVEKIFTVNMAIT